MSKEIYFSRSNEVNPYTIGDLVVLVREHPHVEKGLIGKVVDVVHDAWICVDRWAEASYEVEFYNGEGYGSRTARAAARERNVYYPPDRCLGAWTLRPSDLALHQAVGL